MDIEARIEGLDWDRITREIDQRGWATTGPILTDDERRALVSGYDRDEQFRSTVVMARHGFGQGEYRYFAYPLPPLVHRLRQGLYERLVPLANRWRSALGAGDSFPGKFEDYILSCHAAGQARPTPLILRYRPGDYNCLHQDLYGEHVFPLQVAVLLSAPGTDFTGGEFVLTEQRPRMQSRATVVPLGRGDAAVFAVNARPVKGSRGDYRVTMRHGVSEVRTGQRRVLGLIFHDAA